MVGRRGGAARKQADAVADPAVLTSLHAPPKRSDASTSSSHGFPELAGTGSQSQFDFRTEIESVLRSRGALGAGRLSVQAGGSRPPFQHVDPPQQSAEDIFASLCQEAGVLQVPEVSGVGSIGGDTSLNPFATEGQPLTALNAELQLAWENFRQHRKLGPEEFKLIPSEVNVLMESFYLLRRKVPRDMRRHYFGFETFQLADIATFCFYAEKLEGYWRFSPALSCGSELWIARSLDGMCIAYERRISLLNHASGI